MWLPIEHLRLSRLDTLLAQISEPKFPKNCSDLELSREKNVTAVVKLETEADRPGGDLSAGLGKCLLKRSEFVQFGIAANPAVGYAANSMSDPSQPQPGDIFIMKVAHSEPAFEIGSDLANPQLRCKTYREALRHASNAARHALVDAWQTDDKSSFECVARYRVVA